jgi:guanine nucleotide-binding protein subunit alpha
MGQPKDEDPLTLAIAPPPDETPEERLVREAAEAEAKRISDEIDEQILRDRELMKKKKKPIKLLLLGAFMAAFVRCGGIQGVFASRSK